MNTGKEFADNPRPYYTNGQDFAIHSQVLTPSQKIYLIFFKNSSSILLNSPGLSN
jgi:hypothetical protein